ncbi:MAG: 23S rRNA (pseudouridine(1915)-N(3))-methyltransferase RlmH [Rhizobiales bacterium]|nr:23S rRNA (pseudouridine(1915)-N(3))-methyltransferase RlmH [Hyphomicrobiales bacterium]
MKVDLFAVGKMKAGPERELVQRYAERFKLIGKGLGLDGLRFVELSESPARRDDDRKSEEALALEGAIPEGYRRVVFDERGTTMESAAFAASLGRWRAENQPGIAFVIGGPDGLAPAFVARADLVLAFGKLTIPHQLVRVLVAEQLYRAVTILAGHPYHRA